MYERNQQKCPPRGWVGGERGVIFLHTLCAIICHTALYSESVVFQENNPVCVVSYIIFCRVTRQQRLLSSEQNNVVAFA